MEVERFWVSHQASITTTLYFVNRYAGLVGYIPVLYQFLGENDEDVRHPIQTPHLISNPTPASPQEVRATGGSSRSFQVDEILFPGFTGVGGYKAMAFAMCIS